MAGEGEGEGDETKKRRRTFSDPPNSPLNVSPPRDSPFRLCSNSSIWRCFISVSFFANSIGMFLPSYAWITGRTSGVLKIAIAVEGNKSA